MTTTTTDPRSTTATGGSPGPTRKAGASFVVASYEVASRTVKKFVRSPQLIVAGTAGLDLVSLRNLGQLRTLVLFDGQRVLVEAMKYLAQSDPVINRSAIELLSEHVRTRFRMSEVMLAGETRRSPCSAGWLTMRSMSHLLNPRPR